MPQPKIIALIPALATNHPASQATRWQASAGIH